MPNDANNIVMSRVSFSLIRNQNLQRPVKLLFGYKVQFNEVFVCSCRRV